MIIKIKNEPIENVKKITYLGEIYLSRTYHCFTPTSTHEIQFKMISADAEFSGSFKFIASLTQGIESKISDVKIMDFGELEC